MRDDYSGTMTQADARRRRRRRHRSNNGGLEGCLEPAAPPPARLHFKFAAERLQDLPRQIPRQSGLDSALNLRSSGRGNPNAQSSRCRSASIQPRHCQPAPPQYLIGSGEPERLHHSVVSNFKLSRVVDHDLLPTTWAVTRRQNAD